MTSASRTSPKVRTPHCIVPDRLLSLSLACILTPAHTRAELPENAPRYVVLSYELNHNDGRKSFPLVLVNWAPTSCEMGLLTLHASAFLDFQVTVRLLCATPACVGTQRIFPAGGRGQGHRGPRRRGRLHEGDDRREAASYMTASASARHIPEDKQLIGSVLCTSIFHRIVTAPRVFHALAYASMIPTSTQQFPTT